MSGIVVGVDGSTHSRNALDWALREAVLRRAGLTVLAVSPIATNIYGLALEHYPADEETRGRVEQRTQEIVDKSLAFLGGEAPAVTVRTIIGLPADELIKASEGADLLVVGARGVGGFGSSGR